MGNRLSLISGAKVTLVAACLALALQAQQASSKNNQRQATGRGTFVLQLRDVETGYGVQGTIGFAPAPGSWRKYVGWAQYGSETPKVVLKDVKTDASGRLVLKVPAGSYLMQVTAPGYKPMRSQTGVAAGKTSPGTFELDSIEKPEDLKTVDRLAKPGFATVVGYVVDATTLRPVTGAEIRHVGSGAEATSNSRGFYALQFALNPAPDIACGETLQSFTVNAPGYKETGRRNVVFYPNDAGTVSTGRNYELERGTGRMVAEDPDAWDPTAPVPHNLQQNASTPAWWDVKPARRPQRQPTDEVKKWQALHPQTVKALAQLQKDCGGNYGIGAGIVDAAKFPNDGPEVALVDVCPMGAYTDWILPMQLEDGKPVLSKSRGKDGRLSPFEFASGSSVMHTADVRLVPEDKAIYSIEYSTDGCSYLLRCRVTAYLWSTKTRMFAPDAALGQQGTQGYCNSVQEGLKQSPRGKARQSPSTSE